MRCHLLVQRGELGLAEQMLSKVPEPLVERDTSIAEIYADTCHQLLRGALRKTQKSQAVSCICRIRGVLRILHSEDESNGHRWLDLSILRTLVTANFSNFDEEVQALAMDVCDMIQQKHPEEPPVVVLQLELATRQSNPEPRELYEGECSTLSPLLD
ncbi:hypothetical protein VTN31DRAFT_7054 [Thermomyces dupontii]|uniref:uncharacterized protein n=1 Tax=Talaromyces thermophilus TaxID=28565 RepID=UPI00374373C2